MKNKINEIRKARKITYEKLADLMNTSPDQVYKLISGQRELTLSWLEKLAKALNCGVSELIEQEPGAANSMIDQDRLQKTMDAVELALRRANRKIDKKGLTKLLTEVYNQTLKLESAGEGISPEALAELLLINRA